MRVDSGPAECRKPREARKEMSPPRRPPPRAFRGIGTSQTAALALAMKAPSASPGSRVRCRHGSPARRSIAPTTTGPDAPSVTMGRSTATGAGGAAGGVRASSRSSRRRRVTPAPLPEPPPALRFQAGRFRRPPPCVLPAGRASPPEPRRLHPRRGPVERPLPLPASPVAVQASSSHPCFRFSTASTWACTARIASASSFPPRWAWHRASSRSSRFPKVTPRPLPVPPRGLPVPMFRACGGRFPPAP